MSSRPKPALTKHTIALYDALLSEATKKKIDGKSVLVWEGGYTKFFNKIVSNPRYYTPIRTILTETGSIEFIQRGDVSKPTILILHHKPPDEAEWPHDLTGDAVSVTLRAEFERRITALESWRENLTGGGANIPEVLRDFQARIARLEGKKNGKNT